MLSVSVAALIAGQLSITPHCQAQLHGLCLRDSGQSCVNCVAGLSKTITKSCTLLDITVFCLTPGPATPSPTTSPTPAPTINPTVVPTLSPTPLPTPPLRAPTPWIAPQIRQVAAPTFSVKTDLWKECDRLCCLSLMPNYKKILTSLAAQQPSLLSKNLSPTRAKQSLETREVITAAKHSLTQLAEKVCINYSSFWTPLLILQEEFLLSNFRDRMGSRDCAIWASTSYGAGDSVDVVKGDFAGVSGNIISVYSPR